MGHAAPMLAIVALLTTSTAAEHFNTTPPFYTIYPDCKSGPKALTTNKVCDTSASPAGRAAALVAAMPLADKLQNLIDRSKGSAKLGLPPYEWWSEALHGVALSPGVNFSSQSQPFSSATSFPEPILMSAAFDDDLIRSVADIISTEARAFSNNERAGLEFFTPNINPYRDPRWGRGMETPGESPFRIQGYVKNLLEGLEQKTSNGIKKVMATCKHFAGYDLEDWDGNLRYGFDARIPNDILAGYYLPPFQQCARDSQVGSIMCSYNAVNGVPACDNSYLMNTILREHWGWTVDNQYITSDCNAESDAYTNHHYINTTAAAAGVAYTAGMDTVCVLDGQPSNTTGAHAEGFLTIDVIDRALRRQFEALVILGYFDEPSSDNEYRSYGWSNVNTPAAQTLARKAASNSLVLMKNDGFLPHSFPRKQKVAMIGNWANGTTVMQGNYYGIAPYLHSPLYAASQLDVKHSYANGPLNESSSTGNWTKAIDHAVKGADVVLYFGGINTDIEAEAMDRYQIGWPESQLAVIHQICGLGKPCVVVQMGDQLDQTPLLQNDNVSAIIWAGYPGQSGGSAVFDVLTGAVAPAGRLPVTNYPADYVNEVAMTDMLLQPGPDNPGRTYMWYPNAVLPFGYGLHYTNFTASFASSNKTIQSSDIRNLLSSCSEKYKDLCPFGSTSIQVQNTGKVTSDFVTLLFFNTTAGPSPYPIKELAGYTRLSGMAGGATQTATIPITIGTLARRNTAGDLVLYPGDYELLVDVPTQATMKFSLTGSAATLESWPQPPKRQSYEATVKADCLLEGPCPWQPVTPAQAKHL